MTYYFDLTEILLFVIVFVIIGACMVPVVQFMQTKTISGIADIYQDRNDTLVMVKRKKISIGQESFNIGERQFLIDMSKVNRYEKWNRFGPAFPVLDFDLRDAKPGSLQFKPMTYTFKREPKPSSAGTNMMIRRHGIRQLAQATRNTQMDPKIIGIAMLVVGLGISYLIFQSFHPGLVPAPPSGYHYVVQANPIVNATGGTSG